MVNGTQIAKGVDAVIDTRQSLRVSSRARRAATGNGAGSGAPNAAKTEASMSPDQVAASKQLQVEDAMYAPGMSDKLLGGAGTAVGIGGMVPFIGPAALKIAAFPFSKIGEWTKSEGLQSLGAKISKPARAFEEATFASAGERLGIGGAVGKASQTLANGAGAVAETVDKRVHVGRNLQGRAVGRAHRHLLSAQDHATKLELSEIPAKHRSHFRALHDHVTGAAHTGDLATTETVRIAEQNAKGAVGTIERTVPKASLTNALSGAEEALEDLAKSGASKKTVKQARNFVSSAGKMSDSMAHAGAINEVGHSIRSVPGKLGQAKLGHGLMNGAFIAGSGVSMVSDAKTFKGRLKMLKEMYADMTGTPIAKVSTAKVMLGAVPEPVRVARKLIVKKLAIREATDTIGMGVNIRQAVDRRFNGPLAIAAFILPEMIGSSADSMMGETVLPAYTQFKHLQLEAKAAGQELPAEAYAGFVGEISPELKNRGGSQSRFAQELAKQYAVEKKTAAEIMNELDSGELLSRVHNLIKAASAEKAAAVAGAGAADTKQVSHTQRLAGAKEDMPVLGAHTEKVAAETPAENGVVRS
ncbi:MAG: hypothetical protein ACN2B6_04645 [Rickettsiales bacterium]